MFSTILGAALAAATFQPSVSQSITAPLSNEVVLELGTLSEPLKGDLPTAARQWALGQRGHLGLPSHSTLVNGPSFSTRFGASFHLLQTIQGTEVYQAKVVVTVDEKARVHQVSSSLVHATRLRADWSIDSAEALKRAAAAVELPVLQANGQPYGGSKPQFFEVGDEVHAGYLTYVPTLDRKTNWYVAIDAVTGSILFRQNRVHHGALDANVYPISPGGLTAGVGVTPTVIGQLTHADGGSFIIPNDGGFLIGDQITQYNCCPTANCQPDAGAARSMGTTMVMGATVQYDVAVCQRTRRATNELNGRTDYTYTPVDPPTNPTTVLASDLANSDEFAEVHSFYHVNRVYDWVRGLSTAATPIFPGSPGISPFKMRDERRVPAQQPAIWANFMTPNFQEIFSNFGCFITPPCRANGLSRVDNAAFFPKEQFASLLLPDFDLGVDTLMIFQGNVADAAYDATVIQHEFGHGVVYATANLTFDSLASDSRSANNEGGALHEGFADYVAAAFNNESTVGPYFGPRAALGSGMPASGALRNLANTLKCPDVLWGEVHRDSEHVAAALWDGRVEFVLPAGQYDAAFYAMLVSIAPTADFAQVAAVMSDKVATAFPNITNAQSKMAQFFTTHGVIGCSKVLDVTTGPAREYYGVATAPDALGNSMIPGPYQMKLQVPAGAKKITVTGRGSGGGGGSPFGGGSPKGTLLFKATDPITFTRTSTSMTNDATQTKDLTFAAMTGAFSQALNVAVPCGTDQAVYISIGAPGGGATLQNVAVTAEALVNCELPLPDGGIAVDAGTPDAGPVDAGVTETTSIVVVGPEQTVSAPPANVGCGCQSSADAAPFALAALAYLMARRRSQRQ